ncbi:MAG: aminopeptidase N [Simkaniaceae bacterium]|nr:aminopeptidase N [Simkaniaceae bacterium]
MKKTHLKDYQSPSHLIETTELTFELEPASTRVVSKLQMKKNRGGDLYLNGEDLELVSLKVNGQDHPHETWEGGLKLTNLPESFTLEVENRINPEANKALEGLYMSNGMFCTQNEAEGFRRITYYLDRPDVMSRFTTKIIADKTQFPILLSNGNRIETGDVEGGKHFAIWEDPFLKPCYLFALVGGDLGKISDTFTTCSGREVALEFYTEKGYEDRCTYAMDALKRSMKWDEETFGLEYDLDIYMIVAVDSFNMGAMENKGLNIFNTSCTLADKKTETDENFLRVETVICHEYFHNWTGNRVTCRDWFQLTLKEGLTVFRDQEFSSDMNSRPVKRIKDVVTLKNRQFSEDAGPTAHPIQPKSYIQIDNFYTPTIYEKGAEVIRMIQTLIGVEAFRAGITKYFELFDGMAVTTEDFIHAMELASGKDLKLFRNWYDQKGTPVLKITSEYNHFINTLTLVISQSCPDQRFYKPMHIPLKVKLFDRDGKPIGEERLVEIKDRNHEETFEQVPSIPLISLNRNFTAPVYIEYDYELDDYFNLMKHDDDPVAAFEAAQAVAMHILLSLVKKLQEGEKDLYVHPNYLHAYHAHLIDANRGEDLRAIMMQIPSEMEIIGKFSSIPFDLIHEAREHMLQVIARHCKISLKSIYQELENSADTIGKRALKNKALYFLTLTGDPETHGWACKQYESSEEMNDKYAALSILADIDAPEREKVLSDYYESYKGDTLCMNKWLLLQSQTKLPSALEDVKRLMEDPVFDITVPNLARSLLSGFIANHAQFHDESGSGYQFIADRILQVDSINPHMAARLCAGFKFYRKVSGKRKRAMAKEIKRVMACKELSTNVYEVLSQSLKG